MTWTFWSTPGTSNVDQRRDAVRMFVGDTDESDQQISNEQIEFCLTQTSNDIYSASAMVARMLAAKYARMADSKLEEVETKFSQLRDNYNSLAVSLDAQSAKFGTLNLGVPLAGGISIGEMSAARDDTDRLPPSFETGQFSNPTFDVRYDKGVRDQ